MIIDENNSIKQITFDLNQKALKKHYPKPAKSKNPFFYKKAYKDIADFLKKKGFNHRQYSVYTSKKPMSMAMISVLTKSLSRQFPWLALCVNEIDVSNIGIQHSLMPILLGVDGVVIGKQKQQKKSKTLDEKIKAARAEVSKQTIKHNTKSNSLEL